MAQTAWCCGKVSGLNYTHLYRRGAVSDIACRRQHQSCPASIHCNSLWCRNLSHGWIRRVSAATVKVQYALRTMPSLTNRESCTKPTPASGSDGTAATAGRADEPRNGDSEIG